MRVTALCLCAWLSASAFAADPAPAPAEAKKEAPTAAGGSELKTEDQKTFYALGLYMGRNLVPLSMKSSEMKFVEMGLRDSALGKKPQVDLEIYGPKINDLAKARMPKPAMPDPKIAKARKDADKAFAEKAAKEANTKAFPSGLIYTETRAGTGASPTADDTVKCHYEGRLVDGTVFDSSYKRGQPADFPLKAVVACWTEGIQKMKTGGKARLICPSEIAYGDDGRPPTIPGGATLVFDVELIEIVK